MIRKYTNCDKIELIELLRLNTPKFFDVEEEKDYANYLEMDSENYFVFVDHNRIVAGGGINYGFDHGKTARIAWDIVHPDKHGKGIGKKLTDFRISEIKKNPCINNIIVRTSQLVYEFYEKMGFELEKKESDFWAVGLDLYQMKIAINKI